MAKQSRSRRQPPEPLAYSIPDAVKVSGLSRTLLYDLMGAGELAYTKVRSRRLILRQGLEALLQRRQSAA